MQFPTDILYLILSYLNLPDLLFTAKVCRDWNFVAKWILDKANVDIQPFDKLLSKYKKGVVDVEGDIYYDVGINLNQNFGIYAKIFVNGIYKYVIGYDAYVIEIIPKKYVEFNNITTIMNSQVFVSGKDQPLLKCFISTLKLILENYRQY